jgi:hypothetical protein
MCAIGSRYRTAAAKNWVRNNTAKQRGDPAPTSDLVRLKKEESGKS